MRILWATLCRYAESNNAGLTVVGAGQIFVVTPSLPTEVSVYVAGQIADLGALPATVVISVGVVRSDGAQGTEQIHVQRWQMELDLADEIKHAPNIQPTIGFAIPLKFDAPRAGNYVVGVGIDNQIEGALTIAVVLDQPIDDELQALL